jgi:hypothetical protein
MYLRHPPEGTLRVQSRKHWMKYDDRRKLRDKKADGTLQQEIYMAVFCLR